MIDRNSGIPIYQQLKAIYKQKIADGAYGDDHMFPSEREICALYSISRMTVRQALSELTVEGYLYKAQGKGTFVSNGKIEQNLVALTSFSEDMVRMGRKPGSRILEVRNVAADATIAQRMGIGIGDDVLLFSRVRLADDQPISIEHAYLNGRVVRGIEMGGQPDFSLYLYLKNTLHIPLCRAVQSIETTLLSGKRASLLEVPENTLGLLMNRTTYDTRNRAVEYAQSYYRGDIYKFVIELKPMASVN